MALSGNEQVDTSALYQGSYRSFVHAKTGLPFTAVQDKDGRWIDTYLIVKGDEPYRFVIYYDLEEKIERVERFHVEARPVDKDAILNKNQPYPIDYSK